MPTLLPFFAVIRVGGGDCRDFLHNQLSNDIKGLGAGRACYASYNSPKGRVIANMLVADTGGDLLMVLAADLAEAVVKRLRMFVLRAKVEFDILSDWGVSGSLADNAQAVLPDPENIALSLSFEHGRDIHLPHGGVLTLAPLSGLPPHDPAAEAAWQAHEIQSGYPWIAAATAETCVAQMLNLHRIGAVHFRKGCYPGQEIIARAQYRGQVKRGLAAAAGEAAAEPGDAVYCGGEEAGIVINVSGSLNLLVIKHAATTDLADEQGNPFVLQHLFFDPPQQHD